MRGTIDPQDHLVAYFSPESRVLVEHPLRCASSSMRRRRRPGYRRNWTRCTCTRAASSIAPERLLKGQLLMALYTLRWLAANPKFTLLLPAYHPWVNTVERLWRQLHYTVTRNHHCQSVTALMHDVARFLKVVQPFPGAGHGVAQFGSPI